MGWEERDYHKPDDFEPRHAGIALLPPASLALLMLHGCAFLIVVMMHFDVGREAAEVLPLLGSDSHPAAIVLHPYAIGGEGLRSLLTLLLVGYAIWKLGATVERRLGAGRMLSLYVAGNLAAGLAYFGLAMAFPNLAGAPLMMPAGALAAWCLIAWRRFNDQHVSVFGKLMTVGQAAGLAAAIVAGLTLVRYGMGASVWLGAVAAGAAPALLVEVLENRGHGADVRPAGGEPRRAPRPRRTVAEVDIDDILAKISREGIGSLTDAERERLEAARRAKQRQGR